MVASIDREILVLRSTFSNSLFCLRGSFKRFLQRASFSSEVRLVNSLFRLVALPHAERSALWRDGENHASLALHSVPARVLVLVLGSRARRSNDAWLIVDRFSVSAPADRGFARASE